MAGEVSAEHVVARVDRPAGDGHLVLEQVGHPGEIPLPWAGVVVEKDQLVGRRLLDTGVAGGRRRRLVPQLNLVVRKGAVFQVVETLDLVGMVQCVDDHADFRHVWFYRSSKNCYEWFNRTTACARAGSTTAGSSAGPRLLVRPHYPQNVPNTRDLCAAARPPEPVGNGTLLRVMGA